MGKLTKILFLLIVFLAGCNGDSAVLGKRESKIEKFLTIQDQKSKRYTIDKASSGVYIYTDNHTEGMIKPQIPNILTN